MAAWYLTYATFRNLKSFVPWVNLNNYDDELASIDRAIFFGRDPADLMHDVLGTGFTAQVMSAVYLVWLFLVPVSIAIALVWTRHTRAGSWYVTAVAFDWMLGAVIYLLVPTVGPIYSDPNEFTDLPHTYATWLSEQLLDDRVAVLADPWAAGTMQTIAAFASLHVGIMMTICLVAELVRLPRWVRISAWCFLAMTCISTVYLGWHFFVDVLGGMALGTLGVWLGALATGNRVGLRPRLKVEEPRSWSLPHRPRVSEGPHHVARLAAPAAQWAQQHHPEGDQPGLGSHRRVLAVPAMHGEQVAVHVVALPTGEVVLLVEVELADQPASRTARIVNPARRARIA